MLYTVKNCVEENPQIDYNDGVTKLFLYVGGEIGGSEELKKLLNYMSKSEKENVLDPELLQLHNIVEEVREDRKAGEQYMTLQEYLEYEIEEGIEAGIQARLQERVDAAVQERIDAVIQETVVMLRELSIPDEQIVEKLMDKYQFSEEKAKSFLN